MNNPLIEPGMRPHQKSLVIAAVVSAVVWVMPILKFVLLPAQYLNTHLHEFSHAFVAVITGGAVGDIHVYADGSGLTYATGSAILVNAAGYVGSTIIGALMIWFSRSERGASITLRALGVVLLVSMVLWVRGDLVGIISGLAWMACLFSLPSMMRGPNLVFVAQLLGILQCLASLQAFYILFEISAIFNERRSDAGNMAMLTGIPAVVWTIFWGGIGIFALFVTLRSAWRSHPGP